MPARMLKWSSTSSEYTVHLFAHLVRFKPLDLSLTVFNRIAYISHSTHSSCRKIYPVKLNYPASMSWGQKHGRLFEYRE